MKATAKLTYLRIAPRKVRMVSELIKGKKVEEAQAVLRFTIKKGSLPVLKLLQSAIASAKHNFSGQENNLYISKITVDEGPKLKRVMHMSKGQAFPLQKKTSHITIAVSEINPTMPAKTKAEEMPKEAEKPLQEQKTKTEGSFREKEKTRSAFGGETKVQAPKEVRGERRLFRRKAI